MKLSIQNYDAKDQGKNCHFSWQCVDLTSVHFGGGGGGSPGISEKLPYQCYFG